MLNLYTAVLAFAKASKVLVFAQQSMQRLA